VAAADTDLPISRTLFCAGNRACLEELERAFGAIATTRNVCARE
jgi:hypothetical protein